MIGQQTMGGGGNVTQHGMTPHTKFAVSVTESLVFSPKGVALEDHGVIPEIHVDMVVDREVQFKKALEKAINYLFPGA